jgi:hypothetical protein
MGVSGTSFTGGWVGPRVGLYVEEKLSTTRMLPKLKLFWLGNYRSRGHNPINLSKVEILVQMVSLAWKLNKIVG